MKKKSSGQFKCPWCGRMLTPHKGRVPRHVQSQRIQCVGSGQPMEALPSHGIQYPRYSNGSGPTPAALLLICDSCCVASWKVEVKGMSEHCIRCHSRLRKGTARERSEAMAILVDEKDRS